ncbi:hypothetical protein H6G76_29370 [Nostoc sp. FACHB-152]|uniref:hypothetical protein n=1 Tax=unclassified Nostoc TaxID=2593658 RepID=UPI001682F9DA|nr:MULTISPECIES: hypothetical protein [unclassified Nostoc]MBD2451169.1 hypothetical protein [Nostoc sp. FACHB-152]MBD2472974.1 hypothetical protein [Nostoc sp. FACHB-145]
MTEPATTQTHNGTPTNPTQESLQLARRFSKAIEEFNWMVDYVKFCELLELEPSEYADQEYQYFQQLAEALTRFDAESLAKMIDAGQGNG